MGSVAFSRVATVVARLQYGADPPDPHNRTYDVMELEEPLEIVSLVGTISLREGEPSVHAHACLSDSQGRCFGGHLEHGCEVFACELVLDGLLGACTGARLRQRHRSLALGIALSHRPTPENTPMSAGREEERWCRKGDLNPHEEMPSLGPQPSASTDSAIPTRDAAPPGAGAKREYRTGALRRSTRGRHRVAGVPAEAGRRSRHAAQCQVPPGGRVAR